MSTTARWDRLAATLAEAGIQAEVDRRIWQGETVCNITMLVDGDMIHIRDTVWRGHWTGWQVTAEGADGIVVHWFPKTKNRGEVARHAQAAREVLAAKPPDRR